MNEKTIAHYYVPTKPISYAHNRMIAVLLSLTIYAVSALLNPLQMVHWAAIPVILCGSIIGADMIAWLRGEYDAFDVIGVSGAFGYYFFFLSSIVLLWTNEGIPYALDNPGDFRPVVGIWGTFSSLGLLIYAVVSKSISRKPWHFKTTWDFCPGRTYQVLGAFLGLALVCQLYLFATRGLTAGFERQTHGTAEMGLGVPSILGRSLFLLCCIILFIQYATPYRHRLIARGAYWCLLFVAVLSMFFSTFSASSRGLIVFPLFWVVILIHYLLKPLRARMLAVLVAVIILFGWWHAFYKSMGVEFYSHLWEGRSISDISEETDRTLDTYLLGDMSRIRIQTYLLYHLLNSPDRYDLPLGQTYLRAPTVAIPRWIWHDKPNRTGKVLASTEFLYGEGDYSEADFKETSSHCYGIVGEAMLNFGPWCMPVAYALWGVIVGLFRKYCNGIRRGDLRILIVPLLVWWGFQLLLWDSDNYIGHNINRAVIPVFAIWYATRRHKNVGDEVCPSG